MNCRVQAGCQRPTPDRITVMRLSVPPTGGIIAVAVPLVYRRLDFDVLNYDDARLEDMLSR